MKIGKQLATTFALCGTALFTNIAQAGDCGYYETEGYNSTSVITSGGTPGHPEVTTTTTTFITTGVTYVPLDCGGGSPEPEPEPQSRSEKITAALSNFKLSCRKANHTKLMYQADQTDRCTEEVYSAVEADLWAFGPWKAWVKLGIAMQCGTKVAADIAFVYEGNIDAVPACP